MMSGMPSSTDFSSSPCTRSFTVASGFSGSCSIRFGHHVDGTAKLFRIRLEQAFPLAEYVLCALAPVIGVDHRRNADSGGAHLRHCGVVSAERTSPSSSSRRLRFRC